MIVPVLFALFAIGSTAAEQTSLNSHVDDIIVGVVNSLNGISVPLGDFEHPFAFYFYSRPFEGTLTGKEGFISNIHDISRRSDASTVLDGKKRWISVPIFFTNLKVSYKNYRFQYLKNIDVQGGIEFERAWNRAMVEIIATKSGETCSVSVDEVVLQNFGDRSGKTIFTGDKLSEAFKDNVETFIIEEFPNTGKEFTQVVLNAFQQTIDNSGIDLCKDVE